MQRVLLRNSGGHVEAVEMNSFAGIAVHVQYKIIITSFAKSYIVYWTKQWFLFVMSICLLCLIILIQVLQYS